ncbi:hypothetical protein GE253_12735 [Niveispirillum sp. SYP-B3756]|uniref:HAD family hydrolase n=1 Tax=Niveispirillum sp. SYP-B3756 TaxID=2662178 RepID=UPI0012914644|nr:HAD family hydrolase [Niveispirillum sp. SYP-B3756]MQP66206.1 hypothetical protein [Niveispirillum sp. SYP-B3756]
MTLAALLHHAPLLVSFDIFDTLLLRRVEPPTVLFEQVGEAALAAGLLPASLSPPLFRLARQEAERRARAGQPGGEVDLAAIYAALGFGDPAALTALELALEQQAIFANPLLLPVLRGLAAAGIPVVLLSDMYLAPPDLIRLLQGAGIGPGLYRRLYVSNAEGVSKAGGGLFSRLLADHPQIPPDRILHLGDDPLGDVAMAKAAGLQAIHYVPGPGLARLRERERSVAGLAAPAEGLPPRRAAALAGRGDAADEAEALEFGTLVLGPAVAEYCRWVVAQCRRQGIRRILPLMREAALFTPVLENCIRQTGGGLTVTPLYVSRQALLPLELAGIDATTARHLLGTRPHLPWDRLLQQAGGQVPADLQPWAGLTLEQLLATEAAGPALALFDDPALQARAAAQAAETRTLLLDYLAPLLGEEPVALVDLGARGSTPAALVRLLPAGRQRCQIFLAYAVADIAGPLVDGIGIQVFAGQDAAGQTLGRILYRSPQPLERVLTGLHGTTLGYQRKPDGAVVPVLADPPATGTEARLLGLMQQGIHRYASMMAAACPADSKPANGFAALLPLAAALLRPTAAEAALLGGLAYDQNDGTAGEQVICDATALETVRTLADDPAGMPTLALAMGLRPALAPWPQGALTLLDPGIFQRPADRLGLEAGHGPVCRALVARLRQQGVTRFGILAVGGEGGMGPDFIRHARESGLEPAAYADLMAHLAPPPLFHGVPVQPMAAMRHAGLPLVLVTLGYASQLTALMQEGPGEPPPLISLRRG